MPSTQDDSWEETLKYSTQFIFDRVKDDRIYAQQLLAFLDTINVSTVADPSLWIMAKAYMQTLTQQYAQSTETLNSIAGNTKDAKLTNQINLIKCLNAFSAQDSTNSVIPTEWKNTILQNQKMYNGFLH